MVWLTGGRRQTIAEDETGDIMPDQLPRLALVLAVFTVGCSDGDSPAAPTPTPPGAPAAALMSCPPSMQRQSLDALPVTTTWDLPTVAGIPVDKGSCSPASGTAFPIGTSSVTCAADETALAGSCSFSVTITPPDLFCPPSVARQSVDGLPVPIAWDPPTVMGISDDEVSCSPASGTAFPIGSSTVTCTVDWTALTTADQPPPPSSCSFSVVVTPPDPTLRFTKFMAFGDSITEGVVNDPFLPPGVSARDLRTLLHAGGGRPMPGISSAVQPQNSYPTQLQRLLTPAYPTQLITVANEGRGGERTDQGVSRITSSLLTVRPDVLLLLEGVVDIDLAVVITPPGDTTPIDVAPFAAFLRSMVTTAQGLGVEVLLATLTPVTFPEAASPGARRAILDLNDEIRRMAIDLGLGGAVDLHAALDGVPGIIGVDELHPTVAGYRRMAEIFFAEIVSRYDTTPRPSTFTAVR